MMLCGGIQVCVCEEVHLSHVLLLSGEVTITQHWWILEEKTDIAWGLYLVSSDGRGGHPLTVGQNVKDHLCSIIPWPIRWQEYDTLQMILGILGHRQRVSSSPAPVAGI